MRFYIFLCVIFTLLPLATVGHDIYLAYFSDQGLMDMPFKFSDIGWLLATYAPEMHDGLRASVAQEQWKMQIVPFLEQTAFLVTSVPLILLLIYLVIAKLANIWPCYVFKGDPREQNASEFTYKGVKKAKKEYKYKRKK